MQLAHFSLSSRVKYHSLRVIFHSSNFRKDPNQGASLPLQPLSQLTENSPSISVSSEAPVTFPRHFPRAAAPPPRTRGTAAPRRRLRAAHAGSRAIVHRAVPQLPTWVGHSFSAPSAVFPDSTCLGGRSPAYRAEPRGLFRGGGGARPGGCEVDGPDDSVALRIGVGGDMFSAGLRRIRVQDVPRR